MERNRVKLSFFCWYWFRRGAGEYSRVGVGSVFVLVFFCFFFIFFIFVFFCNRKGRADPSASAHGNRWIMKASMNNEFVVLLISFHLCFFSFLFSFLCLIDSIETRARRHRRNRSGRVHLIPSTLIEFSFRFGSQQRATQSQGIRVPPIDPIGWWWSNPKTQWNPVKLGKTQ